MLERLCQGRQGGSRRRVPTLLFPKKTDYFANIISLDDEEINDSAGTELAV